MNLHTPQKSTGMLLGKFMPPHSGHVYLADFARHYASDLTVLVCSLPGDPIPGELRYQWMRELLPGRCVVHVTENLPQTPEEHPDFWSIWREVVRRHVPSAIDYVFASESYGYKLAEVLGARFIPCDPGRDSVPTSGTAVREKPLANWRFLPACVRPYFVRRVSIFGPESTGKTTLARDLAQHYDTVWVPEHARPLLDIKQGRCDPEDIPLIVRGQIASEEALARQANRIMFCDTDVLTTTIWSGVLFGECPAWIDDLARERRYDLYLLLDVDVPWIDDSQRYLPHKRREFFQHCEELLKSGERPYVRIRGSWAERFQSACAAVDQVLASGRSRGEPANSGCT